VAGALTNPLPNLREAHADLLALTGQLEALNAHLERLPLEQIRAALRTGQEPPQFRSASFETTVLGWQQIVPAQPLSVVVGFMVLVATAAVSVQFGQGSSAADASAFPSAVSATPGTLALAASSGFTLSASWPSVVFATEPGKGLFVNPLSNVQIDGYFSWALVYGQRPAAAS
jgi:hypothetical protein